MTDSLEYNDINAEVRGVLVSLSRLLKYFAHFCLTPMFPLPFPRK